MGSQRFPGKVLKDLCGAPVLQRVIERTKRARSVDKVLVATTVNAEDDVIVELAETCHAAVFRGSSADVLLRYADVVRLYQPEIVIRITSDCPLIDPDVIDRVVMRLDNSSDMASNALTRSWPKGLDVEVVWADTLLRLDRMAVTPQAREHVLWGAYRDELAHFFRVVSVLTLKDDSDLNWCVDTPSDLEHLRRLWEDKPYQALIDKDRSLGVPVA